MPLWAALNAGKLAQWQPPQNVRHVLVFGDNDKSLAGQHAAWSLAYRLKTEGLDVEVRLPDEIGTDWNDVLMSEVGDVAHGGEANGSQALHLALAQHRSDAALHRQMEAA